MCDSFTSKENCYDRKPNKWVAQLLLLTLMMFTYMGGCKESDFRECRTRANGFEKKAALFSKMLKYFDRFNADLLMHLNKKQ